MSSSTRGSLNDRAIQNRLPRYDTTTAGSNPDHSAWAASFAGSVARGQTSGYAGERAWFAQPPFDIAALTGTGDRRFVAQPSCSGQPGPTTCGGCQQRQLTPFSGQGYGALPVDVFAEQYPSQRPTFLAQAQYACNLQYQDCIQQNPRQSQSCVLGRASCMDAAMMQNSP